MPRLFIAFILSLVLSAAFAAPKITQYDSEDQAQDTCPQDTVVWFNPHVRLWYTRKSKHYANDGHGGFVCKEVVVKAGYKQGE